MLEVYWKLYLNEEIHFKMDFEGHNDNTMLVISIISHVLREMSPWFWCGVHMKYLWCEKVSGHELFKNRVEVLITDPLVFVMWHMDILLV